MTEIIPSWLFLSSYFRNELSFWKRKNTPNIYPIQDDTIKKIYQLTMPYFNLHECWIYVNVVIVVSCVQNSHVPTQPKATSLTPNTIRIVSYSRAIIRIAPPAPVYCWSMTRSPLTAVEERNFLEIHLICSISCVERAIPVDRCYVPVELWWYSKYSCISLRGTIDTELAPLFEILRSILRLHVKAKFTRFGLHWKWIDIQSVW